MNPYLVGHIFLSMTLGDEGRAQEICYESMSLLFPGHNPKQTESCRRPLCDHSKVCSRLITEYRQSCLRHQPEFAKPSSDRCASCRICGDPLIAASLGFILVQIPR